MILKFVAKDDLLVVVPGTAQFAGQVARYVNRGCVVERDANGQELVSWPASAEPYCVESDTDEGRRLAKIAQRDGDLLPYDKATADALGLAFVQLKNQSGAWVTAPANTKKGDS